ncbi:hATC-domain-containing protein, partial [Trametes versicolor FP-101664 SS1]|uniref:hATC-domain-containing protein n=1 Tax=Trametes versicolor (strain FP-101664) TaxID=717944 RepID=UPI00046230CA
WGGAEEQQAELDAGNEDAVNWTEYAREVIKDSVRHLRCFRETFTDRALADEVLLAASDSEDEYDRERMRRLRTEDSNGWKDELRRYLEDPALGIKKTTDTVKWWSEHAKIYPTLARMALDILPIPASSVAVERLFSHAKQVSTDRRSRLGPDLFKWLECLSHHWRPQIVDYARLNSQEIEDIDLLEYTGFYEVEELLQDDELDVHVL